MSHAHDDRTVTTYTYAITVEQGDDGSCLAYLDDPSSPLRGFGESPLQAVRALCESIREWPIRGAARWLSTPEGVKLARQFVPGFDPGKPGGSA